MKDYRLDDLRRDVAVRSRKGLPYVVAGGVYWLLMTGVGTALPPDTAALALLLGIGIVMPLAWVFSRMLDAEFAVTDHPLSALGGQIAALNAFFIPVFVVVYSEIPLWTPFTMAVLGGAHFLPYAWYFDSRGYLVLSVTTALGSGVVAFACAAMDAMAASFVSIPAVCVGTHALSAVLLQREVARLRGGAADQPRPKTA